MTPTGFHPDAGIAVVSSWYFDVDFVFLASPTPINGYCVTKCHWERGCDALLQPGASTCVARARWSGGGIQARESTVKAALGAQRERRGVITSGTAGASNGLSGDEVLRGHCLLLADRKTLALPQYAILAWWCKPSRNPRPSKLPSSSYLLLELLLLGARWRQRSLAYPPERRKFDGPPVRPGASISSARSS